ncbi:MAG TPA: hypothetical protein VM915_08170, partial [Verrucomicrobiae bacterium]|nr:hypothetical protein [Verrucomicrobiae bacterium]
MLAALLASAALSACAVRIDETDVFRPQAHAAPARTAAEMSRWPEAELRQRAPDVVVRHGFVGEGAARIAYTLIARPGEDRPLVVSCGGNASDRYNAGLYYVRKA